MGRDRVFVAEWDIAEAMRRAEARVRATVPGVVRVDAFPERPGEHRLGDGWFFVGLLVAYLAGDDGISWAVRFNLQTREGKLVREWE